MEVNRDNFSVTLFSNASTDIYIYNLNSQTSFTNRLALPVDLGSSSDWEVGPCEISYKPHQHLIVQGALVDVIGEVNVIVHCNLITPQLVASELTRLLRTIITPSQLGQHLFPNIYYLPVERNDITSIHIELSLVDHDRPIVFLNNETQTPTKVVLHFRRTKWEMLLAGIDTFPRNLIDKSIDTR